jgi:hypothetical protein
MPSSRYCSPKFGAVPTSASNYSQYVHRLPNPRVPLCSSRRGLRHSAFGSSIGPPNLRQSTDLASVPTRVFFPGEPPPWISTLVLYFFSPLCAAPLSPHRPPVRARPAPARARPAPAPWHGGGDRPWRRTAARGGGAAPARTSRRPLRARPSSAAATLAPTAAAESSPAQPSAPSPMAIEFPT